MMQPKVQIPVRANIKKICIGLAPLLRIGPRSDVGGLTGAKLGEVF